MLTQYFRFLLRFRLFPLFHFLNFILKKKRSFLMISIHSLVCDLLWTNFVEFDNTLLLLCNHKTTQWLTAEKWLIIEDILLNSFIANWNKTLIDNFFYWAFFLSLGFKIHWIWLQIPDYHLHVFSTELVNR